MINRDLLTGLGIILLSLLGLFVIIPAGVVVAGISVLIKLGIDKLRQSRAPIHDEETALFSADSWRLVLVIPGLFGYYYLINGLGIQLSSGLILVIIMLLGA